MIESALALAAFVFAQSAAGPIGSQEPVADLELEIGVHTQQSSGRRSSFAGNHGADTFQSYVWTGDTLCWLAASGREPATVPALGWYFRGRVLKRTGDEFLVDIEWARLWDRSTRLTDGPKGSMQVTLRSGERLALDEVVPAAGTECQIVAAKLEAAIVPRATPRRVVTNAGGIYTGLGAGATAGGSGSGGARSGGAGRGSGITSSGSASGATGVGAGRSGASAGAEGFPYPDTLPFTATGLPANRRMFDGELWLVHKLPSGLEEVQRLTVVFGRTDTRFAFPPIEVIKDGERGTVDVTGSLYLGAVKGQEKLIVHLGRTFKKTRTSSGGSFKPVDIPEGGEVLSFELPVASSDPGLRSHFEGHLFSVRLRVTPK